MDEATRRQLAAYLRQAYGWAATDSKATRSAIDAALEVLFDNGILDREEAQTPEPYEIAR